MADATQTVLTVAMPALAVLIGILVNNSRLGDTNKRIDDLRSHMDNRFNSVNALFAERLRRVEQLLDAHLKHLEEHFS